MKRLGQQVCLWLFIISAVVWGTILLTYAVYPVFMHLEDLPAVAGLSSGRLYHNYVHLLTYLQVPGVAFSLPDFRWSASGAQHFADVKKLFVLAIVAFWMTVWPAWHWLRQLRQTRQRYLLIRPFQIGALVPLVLGALMAVNFDAVFIGFHKLMFRNNDWLFDPSVDPIINVLPENFFAACFGLALLLFEAVMVWGLVSGRRDAKLQGQ